MLQQKKIFSKKAQSILEYATILGIVTIVFTSMQPFIKRAIQGTIKTVADQIGSQEKAEQDYNAETGFLINSSITSSLSGEERSQELYGDITKIYTTEVTTSMNSSADTGIHDIF